MRATALVLTLLFLPALGQAQPPPWPNGVSTPMGTIPPDGVYMVVIEPQGRGTMPVIRNGAIVHPRPVRLVTTPALRRVLLSADPANHYYTFSISYRMPACPATTLLVIDGRGVVLADDTADPSDCTYEFDGIDRALAARIQRRFAARRRNFRAGDVPRPVPIAPNRPLRRQEPPWHLPWQSDSAQHGG